jgi:hypothetical protein
MDNRIIKIHFKIFSFIIKLLCIQCNYTLNFKPPEQAFASAPAETCLLKLSPGAHVLAGATLLQVKPPSNSNSNYRIGVMGSGEFSSKPLWVLDSESSSE